MVNYLLKTVAIYPLLHAMNEPYKKHYPLRLAGVLYYGRSFFPPSLSPPNLTAPSCAHILFAHTLPSSELADLLHTLG